MAADELVARHSGASWVFASTPSQGGHLPAVLPSSQVTFVRGRLPDRDQAIADRERLHHQVFPFSAVLDGDRRDPGICPEQCEVQVTSSPSPPNGAWSAQTSRRVR